MADVAENGIEENGDVDVPEIELIIRVSTKYFGKNGCDLSGSSIYNPPFTVANIYYLVPTVLTELNARISIF